MATFDSVQLEACEATTQWTTVADRDCEAAVATNTQKYEGTNSIGLTIDKTRSDASDWGEYYWEPSSVTDISKYNSISFQLYLVAGIISSEQLSHFTFQIITDSADANYYEYTIPVHEVDDTTDAWQKITLNFNHPTKLVGNPDKTTFQKFNIKIYHNDSDIATMYVDDFRAESLEEAEYDLKIDGQGYLLLPDEENVYAQSNLPYQHDRFSTGEVDFSDWNFYQYKTQTDWSAGFPYKYNTAEQPNTFWDGDYLNITTFGELKSADIMQTITAAAMSGTVTGIQAYKQSAFVAVVSGSAAPVTGHIYSWPGSGNTLTYQNSAMVNDGIYDMTVYQNELYVGTGDSDIMHYNGSSWSAIAQSATFMSVLGDTLYAAKPDGSMQSFDGTTWTSEYTHTGMYIQRIKTWRNKIYYLATDQSTGDSFSAREHTTFYSYDGVDRLKLYEFNEGSKRSIEYSNNKLWFIVGGILYSYDGTNLDEELNLISADDDYEKKSLGEPESQYASAVSDTGKGLLNMENSLYAILIGSLAQNTDGRVLKNTNDLGFVPYANIAELSGEARDVTALGGIDGLGNESDVLMLGTSLGSVYYFEIGDTTTTEDRIPYVTSGIIDMGFPNVEKQFVSMGVYTDLLPQGSLITIYYDVDETGTFTRLVTNAEKNSSFIEAELPNGTYGKKIRYKIELESIDGSSPVIKDIFIKYIIAPHTKKKWNLNLAIAQQIEKADNTREEKNAKQLKNKLWDSRLKRSKVEYQDIDGSTYDVYINDIQILGPVRNKNRRATNKGPEYHAFVELIEA